MLFIFYSAVNHKSCLRVDIFSCANVSDEIKCLFRWLWCTFIKFKLFDHAINWLFLIPVDVLEISNRFRKSSAVWVISITAKPGRDWESAIELPYGVGSGDRGSCQKVLQGSVRNYENSQLGQITRKKKDQAENNHHRFVILNMYYMKDSLLGQVGSMGNTQVNKGKSFVLIQRQTWNQQCCLLYHSRHFIAFSSDSHRNTARLILLLFFFFWEEEVEAKKG